MTYAPAQSCRMSLTETLASTVIGYAINQVAQIVLFPLVGIRIPLSTNIALGVVFTLISVARGFCLRRLFEGWRIR